MSNTTTYSTIITNTTFRGESRISSLDLNNRPIQNKNMEEAFVDCTRLKTLKKIKNAKNLNHAFYNCTSLKNVPSIPDICTTMEGTFQNCINFNALVTIPQSVTNVTDCFNGCKRLEELPEFNPESLLTSIVRTFKDTAIKATPDDLPDTIIDMTETYNGCRYMTTADKLPSSLQILEKTFYDCSSLNKIEEIPASVTNMKECFYNCNSLFGNITILSENVTDATNCFYLPNSVVEDRNVYLPIPSITYNSFVAAGYNQTTRQHGVLLIPLEHHFVRITLQSQNEEIENVQGANVKVNDIPCRTTLDTHENGLCISGCKDNVFYAFVKEHCGYTIKVSLDGFDDFEQSYEMQESDQDIIVNLHSISVNN